MIKGKRLLVAGLTAVFALAGLSSIVFSQASSDSGSGLSISPTRTELSIDPGGSDVVRINLKNVTSNDIVARAFVNEFESDDETGEPKIIIDENSQSPTSIKPFLRGVNDIELKQGEDKSFDIGVEIPSDAAPGAYYGIIRYAAIPVGGSQPDAGQLSLTASVGTIVLIEVPGAIREQVQVREILVYRGGVAGTFFGGAPEEAGILIMNQGNSFAKPFGTVEVNNPFGKTIQKYEINDSDPRSNVLPNSSRVFRNRLDSVSMPGRYTVTAHVSFGNGGEILTISKAFWYLPIWFLLIIVLILALLTAAVYQVRKRFGSPSPKPVKKRRRK